jgi:hypothetical protein
LAIRAAVSPSDSEVGWNLGWAALADCTPWIILWNLH